MKTDKKSFLIKFMFALVVSIVICLMSVSSILHRDNGSQAQETDVIIIKEHTVTPVRKSTAQKEQADSVEYFIEERNFKRDQISIKYPQIQGLNNQELQKESNELIEQRVLERTNILSAEDTYELNYIVKEQTDHMISIIMTGTSYIHDAMYPSSVLYTINVDLENSRIWKLENVSGIEEIAESLRDGKNLPMYDMEGNRIQEDWQIAIEEYLDQETLQGLTEDLQQFDVNDNLEIEPVGYSYFENGKLHICISVPHALGDYIDIIPDRTIQIEK